jgi:hypothetical protein
LLHKRQGRQRAQQQLIGHACSCSLHLQPIYEGEDAQVLVEGHQLIQGADFPSSWPNPGVRLLSTPPPRLLYRFDTIPSASSSPFRTSLLVYHLRPLSPNVCPVVPALDKIGKDMLSFFYTYFIEIIKFPWYKE